MNLLKAKVSNFGSYNSLEFDFSCSQLALIHGATGSGKSTLQEVPVWILYGKTSKGGNVSEIITWNSTEPTIGEIQVELKGEILTIVRTRGKASHNDLYWLESEVTHRGKDITETQKLLEERLGVTYDLYISAASYNEFSPASTFFTDKSKERRELFEKIVDLKLPIKIAERALDVRREAKKKLTENKTACERATGRSDQLKSNLESNNRNSDLWSSRQDQKVKEIEGRSSVFEKQKILKIEALETKSSVFEANKLKSLEDYAAKIEILAKAVESQKTTACETCGAPNEKALAKIRKLDTLMIEYEQIEARQNPYLDQIEQAKKEENHLHSQIEEEKYAVNPFLAQNEATKRDIEVARKLLSSLESQVRESEDKISALGQLYDLSFKLRGHLLQTAVKHIEESTNKYLESYFDSEFRVEFTLEDSDNLEISIQKDGHSCFFTQLSKGQRSLLKLTFSIAIMKASANNSGVHFNTLFFDEALDGLDTELKLKAFGLFNELEKDHNSILIIDHSTELKSLFTSDYHVTLNGNGSTLQ